MTQNTAPELQKIFSSVESEYSKIQSLVSDAKRYAAFVKGAYPQISVRENKRGNHKFSYSVDGVILTLGMDNVLVISTPKRASKTAQNVMRALTFNRDAKETQFLVKDSLGQMFQGRARQVLSTTAKSVEAPKTVMVPIEHADNYMRAAFAHILSQRGISLRP